MGQFDESRAIDILIASAFFGNSKAAKKYGVGTSTIQNWKIRLRCNADFLAKFETAYKKFCDDWLRESVKGMNKDTNRDFGLDCLYFHSKKIKPDQEQQHELHTEARAASSPANQV